MRLKSLKKYLPIIGVVGLGVGLYLLTKKPKPKPAITASNWVDQNLFGPKQRFTRSPLPPFMQG